MRLSAASERLEGGHTFQQPMHDRCCPDRRIPAVPMEMALWRIEEDQPRSPAASGIGDEQRLESIIADEVEILDSGP